MYQVCNGGHPIEILRRKPGRVTATLSWSLLAKLNHRAALEGRSLSNLVASLLERAVDQ
jgi:hypothetical protein